jgi:hypothetical protein
MEVRLSAEPSLTDLAKVVAAHSGLAVKVRKTSCTPLTLRQVAQVAKLPSALDLGLSDVCSVMECDGLVVEVSSMGDLPWGRPASAEDVRSVIREKMATLQHLTMGDCDGWFLC